MIQNQNETGGKSGKRKGERGEFRPHSSFVIRHSSFSLAFTLVELLVVITIISILAGLITGAAINALGRAKQAAITLEIQQLSSAIEDFKNEYGAYPPNVHRSGNLSTTPINERTLNGTTLLRFLKKSFARSTEFNINAPSATPWNNNVTTIADQGLSPAEALVFWLQGFSGDVARPLSGTDLVITSIEYTNPETGMVETPTPTNVVTIDTRQPRYDFDRGRLRMSRDGAGNRRFLTVQRPNDNTDYQIQLYEYLAPNSEEPFVYFDTSRETPLQVVDNWETTEFFYATPSPNTDGRIYPLKQMRADTPAPADRQSPRLQYVEYVNVGKFQILHCGLDDAWGDFFLSEASLNDKMSERLTTDRDFPLPLLFPTGPFLGDLADTVGNFGTGTLEDAQE